MAERFGIATAAEMGVASYAMRLRLRDEVIARDGVVRAPVFAGAWSRVA